MSDPYWSEDFFVVFSRQQDFGKYNGLQYYLEPFLVDKKILGKF